MSSSEEDQEWLDYRSRFAEIYDQSNYESPLQSFVMGASHRLLERSFGPEAHFDRVLEVGAGTGAHLQFVRHRFGHYTMTDMDPKALVVARQKTVNQHQSDLRYEVQKGAALEYPNDQFDRLIAVHVLEHIYEPHLALKEWRRVIRKGGVLSVLIPTDPGLAWRMGRHLGPRRNAIQQGIAYDYVMAREHVNACNNLVALLRHYFPVAKESWWPLPVASIDLNLFFAFHARIG